VVTGFTANVLLAVGASPAMVEAVEEAGEFAGVADALLINVGTITTPMAEAMRAAVASARDRGTPWVLDPVAVGAISFRTKVATELLSAGPAIVRAMPRRSSAWPAPTAPAARVWTHSPPRPTRSMPPGRWPARMGAWSR